MKRNKEPGLSPEFMAPLKDMPKPPKYNRYQKVARLCVERLNCISLDGIKDLSDRDRITYVAGLLESLMFMDDKGSEDGTRAIN